jgi:transcriptional regulator with XRE-family HTH domain
MEVRVYKNKSLMIDLHAEHRGFLIRRMRESHKMRLADLAEKTRLSISFLSQVERGLINPSINSLRKIATALDTTLSSFFDEPKSVQGPVIRREERKILVKKDSRLTYQLLSSDHAHRIEFLPTRLEVGATSANSPMAHKGDEAALVLQGGCTFELGNDRYDLNEGDSIYINENTPHRFVNISNVPLIIVSAISPPGF